MEEELLIAFAQVELHGILIPNEDRKVVYVTGVGLQINLCFCGACGDAQPC